MRPKGVEINPLSVGKLILELLLVEVLLVEDGLSISRTSKKACSSIILNGHVKSNA
jgi:hypothetical protein